MKPDTIAAAVVAFAAGLSCGLWASDIKKDILPLPRPEPVVYASYEIYEDLLPPLSCGKVKDEIDVLACTIYFEARNQPFWAQVGVAQAVIHRVHDRRYPSTAHGVVWQKKPSIQFQWTQRFDLSVKDVHAWMGAVEAARMAQSEGSLYTMVDGRFCDLSHVVSFHDRSVQPGWHGYEQTCRVGDLVFYRERGH